MIVVAAVIEKEDRFLVTRRQAGVHLAGMWEFPGGKVHTDMTTGLAETHVQALRREIGEELAADVAVGDLVFHTTHAYADRTVTLYFYRCRIIGTPAPQLGQEMRWVSRDELATLEFPPADAELIRLLAE